MGFGPVDAMVVMEELGRGIVLEPYAAVALVATQLLGAGHAPSAALWLQGISEGKELVVLAHQERAARYRLAHVETTAKNVGDAQPPRPSSRRGHAGAFMSRRAPAAVSTTRPGSPCSSSRAASPARGDAYPTQDGAAAELVLKDAGASSSPAGEALPASMVDIGTPRSAPRRWARWTSWSR
jgi:hypothetical protein